MRILQILPKIPFPPVDGHTKSMWGLIEALAKRGHYIEIVAYQQGVEYSRYLPEIEKYAKLLVIDVDTKNSVAGAMRNLFSPVPYNLSKYRQKELSEFLIEKLEAESFDIIHVTNAHMGWVIDQIRKITRTPVVLREENLELSIMYRYFEKQKNPLLKFYSFLQYRKFLRYEPELCAKFDRVIMISPVDNENLLKLNSTVKSITIPLGVDSGLFEINDRPKEKDSLFFVGSLKWFPNLDGLSWFLNDVFPKVLVQKPATKLYLYGGGMPGNFALFKKYPGNIIVKGFVDDLWTDLKDKQLGIVPLRIGGGIRVKILELLAAGHNVISTSLGCEGIGLTDGKEIIIADSPYQFAQKIVSLLNGEYDTGQLSESGRTFVANNYSWDSIAAQFENTYKNLLAN